MRFAFTEDQLAVRDAVTDLLARECSPEVVRAAWPAPDADGQGPGAGARADAAAVDRLWSRLVEMGVPGLLVAEEAGGLAFDEVAAVLVLEAAGSFAAPVPLVESVCVAAPLFAEVGLADRLAAVLGGDRVGVVDPFLGAAAFADGLDEALCFDAGGEGVSVVGLAGPPLATVDAGLALRRPDAHTPTSLDVDPAPLAVARRRALERAALGSAALLLGSARRMLEVTVAYAQERKQFGVAIGSFQAVKHHLADARLHLEFAAPAVYRAAWSLATGDRDAVRDVSMAKVMAAQAAHRVGRKALQCHGGIGYTVEYDLHLFLKRTWALERAWGDVAHHRARVAAAIGV